MNSDIIIEQSIEELAQAMKESPELYAEMYLEMKKQISLRDKYIKKMTLYTLNEKKPSIAH